MPIEKNKPRILVVEDEVIVARDIQLQLKELGYEAVGHATTGEQAAFLAETLQPDLVLMDIQLSGAIDGIAAAQIIHEKFSLPIVFLTAFAEDDTLARAVRAEPLGYILKPFSERELRTVLEMALYKSKAEARLRISEAALKAVSQGVAIAGTDRAILSVNQAFESITGYGEAEALGQDYCFVHGALTDEGVADSIRRAFGNGGEFSGEILNYRKDGTPFWSDLTLSPVLNRQGRVTHFVGVTRDITARRLAEAKLRLSEENLAITLQSIGDAVIATDAAGLITRMNPTAERLTGWSVVEARGRALPEVFRIINAETRATAINPVQLVMERGEIVGLANHTALLSRDHKEYQIFDSAAPIRDMAGAIVGVVLVFSDVTESYHVRKRLATTAALLERTGEMAKIGGGELDLRTMEVYWTLETCRIHDIDPPVAPAFDQVIALYSPEVRPAMLAAVRSAIDQCASYDLELPMITPKGRHVWVRAQGSPVIENGKAIRLVGAFQDITERKQAEIERINELRVLEMVARGAPLAEVLTQLVLNYEGMFPGMRGSVLLLEPSGRHVRHASAPSLPLSFCEAIDGREIGPAAGSCGTAAYTGKNTIVADIAVNPLWRDYKSIALAHGLLACWSVPITGAAGRVLGTFAFYFSVPRSPLPEELATLERGAYLASMAIARLTAEAALNASVEYADSLFRFMQDGFSVLDSQGVALDANPALCQMTGFSREELLGVGPPFPYWPPEEYGRIESAFVETLRGNFCDFELTFMRRNGERFPVIVSPSAIKKADGKIINYLATVKEITERKKAENLLRAERNFSSAVLEKTAALVVVLDSEGRIRRFNRAAERLSGLSFAEVEGRFPWETFLPPEDADSVRVEAFESLARDPAKVSSAYLNEWLSRTGERFLIEWNNTRLFDANGRMEFMVAIGIDITERRRAEEEKARLEAQLQQAQKMESVGRLAGGVAHDFNNMLAVIHGHAELALGQVDPGQPLHDDLLEIQKAAERSAGLTRQLLAYARKQTVAPKVLDLNDTVTGMLKLLQRLIGEDIHLTWRPEAALWPISMDASQLDQLLANLCVNARDAIADVGGISISTANTVIDGAFCVRHTDAVPGEYVLLSVADTGCGMDRETLSHIFEPFYTTKAVGEGTGLGLATVYGAVKQNRGFITVASEVGGGTTFSVYFPRHVGQIEKDRAKLLPKTALPGKEVILVVEDEPGILKVTVRVLEAQGYAVLGAASPEEAIRLAEERGGRIDLLVSDVVMPGMNGRDLAKRLLSQYPHLKTLFMSGFTADVIAHRGVLDEGVKFIQKPFSIAALANMVRQALDSAAK